jgi:RNA recognition motif-containing protein
MKLMKLYVGNLPSSTSVKDLEDLFTPYGNLTSARVLTIQNGGHPRGFCYVEMVRQNAVRAMSELHGQRIDFMDLRVREAKSCSPTPEPWFVLSW